MKGLKLAAVMVFIACGYMFPRATKVVFKRWANPSAKAPEKHENT